MTPPENQRSQLTETQADAESPHSLATNDSPAPLANVHRETLLEGRIRLLLLYDIGEQIDLTRVQQIFGDRVRPVGAQTVGGKSQPYVRFTHMPLVQKLDTSFSIGDHPADLAARYYSFGVLVLQIEIPFHCDWAGVVSLFDRMSDAPVQYESRLKEILANLIKQAAAAIIKPAGEWLAERYIIVNALKISDASGADLTPQQVKTLFGGEIAKLLRDETAPLAADEIEDVLSASLSYYESDLIVVTSTAALIYDRPPESAAESYILEYARVQLLEFRYYDALMENLLNQLYDALEKERNALLARWTIPRDAKRFNQIRVDTMELKERVDNAIKFVSDAFYAKMYRTAAARMGVTEYRELVDEKIETVGQLHEFMIGQYNEARSFILEVIAAILALVDVLYLLRGR